MVKKYVFFLLLFSLLSLRQSFAQVMENDCGLALEVIKIQPNDSDSKDGSIELKSNQDNLVDYNIIWFGTEHQLSYFKENNQLFILRNLKEGAYYASIYSSKLKCTQQIEPVILRAKD